MFMPILVGLDGVEKMSKSLGNYIGVNEVAEVMFKKVMEVPDDLIISYYELTTDEHPDKIDEIKKQLENGRNPRDIKYELAKTITALYHTDTDVQNAIAYYDKAFSKKAIPDNIPEIKLSNNGITLNDLLPVFISENFIQSRSEFIRLVNQGGVQINGIKTNTIQAVVSKNDVIKIGKKKFIRFI